MKRMLLVTFVLLLALSVSAQDNTTGMTNKGIKAGINISNWSGDDADGFDSKMGLAFGGFFDFAFSPTFGLQAEVLYSQKGMKESFLGEDMTLKTDYIEIPLLLKYKFATQGNLKPAIVFGPAVGFLTKADAEGEDVKDYFKSTDFGLAFGLSLMVENANGGGITFDGRYTMGMSKILEEDPEDPGYEPDIKNTSITFLVGYCF